jgi:hypothetical protein
MATGSFSAFLVSWRVELSEKEDDSQRERINDEGDVTRRKKDSIVTLLLYHVFLSLTCMFRIDMFLLSSLLPNDLRIFQGSRECPWCIGR